MATIIETLALSGSRKADGTVNAGGRVFLTVPGSASVAVTAWADRDKSAAITLNGGGVLLDAAGKAAIFIEEPASVRVEDATGATVAAFNAEVATNAGLVEVVNTGFTGIDPVSGQYVAGGRTNLDAALSAIYASMGGLDGKYRGTYGTADRYLKEQLEAFGLMPQQFGAKGDGVTDNTTAFGLMAQAQAASGLPVFIPKGTYILSAVTTFTLSGAIVRGASKATILRGTNGTMNMLSFSGIGPRVESLVIDHSATTTGTALTFANFGYVRDVTLTGGDYTTGLSCVTSSRAVDCDINAITTATVGPWLLDYSTAVGAVSATTTYNVMSAVTTGAVQRSTADMANGGNTTPTAPGSGVAISYQRIRATSAGSGTVNATATPASGAEILVLDLFNNSGGAYTFNLNAQYHGSTSAPAPANGQRIVCSYAWNTTESIWVMIGAPTASFA